MKRSIHTLWFALGIALTFSAVSCSDNDEPEPVQTISEKYAGNYDGVITLNVAGKYQYDATITCNVIAEDAETISVTIPEYTLTGTMMGDLSLGAVTITGIKFNDAKGGFYRDFGGEGLTQSMNGTTYPLNDPSSILVTLDENKTITIDYPFTLGKMPLPLTATFKGAAVK